MRIFACRHGHTFTDQDALEITLPNSPAPLVACPTCITHDWMRAAIGLYGGLAMLVAEDLGSVDEPVTETRDGASLPPATGQDIAMHRLLSEGGARTNYIPLQPLE